MRYVALVLCGALVCVPAAGAKTFKNTEAIAPPNNGQDSSSIAVGGLKGQVTKAEVTIKDLGTSVPADLDILLVAPKGERAVVMSDACPSGSFNAANLTFADSAGSKIADSCGTDSAGGTFQPTDNPPEDSFNPPAPQSVGYPSKLKAFVGAKPKGNWRLFVYDDEFGAQLAFIGGGWSLDLKTKECKRGENLNSKGKCVPK